jgi:hypothetical protein
MTFYLVTVAGRKMTGVRRLRVRLGLAGCSILQCGRVKTVAEELAIIQLKQVLALPSARLV